MFRFHHRRHRHCHHRHRQYLHVGGIHFARALLSGALPKLVHVSFGVNHLSDSAVVALSCALADPGCSAHLEYLGLGSNRIGDDGAAALSDAMAYAPGLSRLHGLWLADNADITDQGAIALAGGIQKSEQLHELYVHGLGIHQTGCDAFIDAIKHLPRLRRCVLGRATPEAINRIAALQQRMRNMTDRQDVVISSWPCLEGNRARANKTPRANPMPLSTLRVTPVA